MYTQWIIRYQRFSNILLVAFALVSMLYLPIFRDAMASAFQTLLRLAAPMARSIISQVD